MKSVLIVDSSAMSRRLIEKCLLETTDGLTVFHAESGEEALRVIGELRVPLDLVTTSMVLVEMDGLEMCRAIRESEIHGYVPVIVVSSGADLQLEREGYSAGVTEYFDKSRGPQALAEFLQSFLRRNASVVGRILYVEDSPLVAREYLALLRNRGFKVDHLTTGEDALARLKDEDLRAQYDLVLTDFHLKGERSGGDIIHFIRGHLHLASHELPALVVTAVDDEQMLADIFRAGADDILPKKAVRDVVISRIGHHLKLKRVTEDLKEKTITDPLTKTKNKRFLLEQGDSFLSKQENQPAALFVFDLDHFKKINDTKGHLTGDKVLIAAGSMLNDAFRGGTVCRYGGEEFVVLVKNASLDHANTKAEEIRRRLETLRPEGLTVTSSIGVASTSDTGAVGLTQMIEFADKAVYAAKGNGRNRVYYWRSKDNSPFPYPG